MIVLGIVITIIVAILTAAFLGNLGPLLVSMPTCLFWWRMDRFLEKFDVSDEQRDKELSKLTELVKTQETNSQELASEVATIKKQLRNIENLLSRNSFTKQTGINHVKIMNEFNG